MTDLTPDQCRDLIAGDWLTTRMGQRLHAPDRRLEDGVAQAVVYGSARPVLLACGVGALVALPAPEDRMGAQRCVSCCRATGTPPGDGSPKNIGGPG